jgi:ribosomal protein S6E (S10)
LKSILGKDKYMPMCDKNIPREGYAKHGRNFQNKSDIYFMTIKPGGQGGTGFCMRSDEFGHELSKPNY